LSASAVAKNYAEVLLQLAQEAGELDGFGDFIEATALAVQSSPQAMAALMSPKVPKGMKAEILGNALSQVGAPRPFVLFLRAIVRRGRQGQLDSIAVAYRELVDQKLNRVRASVTVARVPDEALKESIRAALSKLLSKDVITQFQVDPDILGGAVIRVGDRIYDGSARRRLLRLRRHLLSS